ncbi:large subunit of N,N-dimethylformamidase [soil metagenome]
MTSTPEPVRRLAVPGTQGYVERIGVAPGGTVRFHVSAPASFGLDVVRLGRSAILEPDADAAADRADMEPLATFRHEAATPRTIAPGSYVFATGTPIPGGPVAVGLWIRPWRLPVLDELQWAWAGLVSDLDYPSACRFALLLDPLGRIGLYAGDGGPFEHGRLRLSEPLVAGYLGRWLHVAASIGPSGVRGYLDGEVVVQTPGPAAVGPVGPAARLRIGATAEGGEAADFLDADIAAPFVATAELKGAVLAAIVADRGRSPVAALGVTSLRGSWQLREQRGRRLADSSGLGRHGRLVGGGTWQVGGPAFDAGRGGPDDDPVRDPDRGAALRLSSDDLEDCGWPVSAAWQVPADAPSGLYAGVVRLDGQAPEDALAIPFVVVRRRARRPDSVAVVMATNTWYAYGRRPRDGAAIAGLSSSYYSTHASGRPFFHVPLRAPIPRADPFGFESTRAARVGHSHLVRPERYAEAWLEREGYAYELITDLDLHAEPSLLRGFRALMVCGHSEYWTAEARDGVEGFLDAGGDVLWLSGNSLMWRVSVDPSMSILECRKEVAEDDERWLPPGRWGERWHAHDGRAGGSWLRLGRPGHLTSGLDSQGMIDDGTPTAFAPLQILRPEHELFHRPERVPVTEAGTIGELGLNGPRVSGYEFDAVPEVVGTRSEPLPGQVRLASALGQRNLEWQGQSPEQGADVVWWERPAGGRVFAIGSIGATGALAVDPGVGALVSNVLAIFDVARADRPGD